MSAVIFLPACRRQFHAVASLHSEPVNERCLVPHSLAIYLTTYWRYVCVNLHKDREGRRGRITLQRVMWKCNSEWNFLDWGLFTGLTKSLKWKNKKILSPLAFLVIALNYTLYFMSLFSFFLRFLFLFVTSSDYSIIVLFHFDIHRAHTGVKWCSCLLRGHAL